MRTPSDIKILADVNRSIFLKTTDIEGV